MTHAHPKEKRTLTGEVFKFGVKSSYGVGEG